MDIKSMAESKVLFSSYCNIYDPSCLRFSSIKGRFLALLQFAKSLFLIPVAIYYKLLVSIKKVIGFGFSLLALISTLALSSMIRGYFLKRLDILTKDLGDWVLYPFALFSFVARQLVGIFIHPRLSAGV